MWAIYSIQNVLEMPVEHVTILLISVQFIHVKHTFLNQNYSIDAVFLCLSFLIVAAGHYV